MAEKERNPKDFLVLSPLCTIKMEENDGSESESKDDYIDFNGNRKFLFKKVTMGLQFRNKSIQNEFQQFCLSRNIRNLLLGFTIYYTFILSPSCIIAFLFIKSWQQILFSTLFLLLSTSCAVTGWLLYFEHRFDFMKSTFIKLWIQSVMIMGVGGCILCDAYRDLFSDCSDFPHPISGITQGWHCVEDSIENAHAHNIVLLTVYPMLVLLILNDVRIVVIVSVSCIANALLCALFIAEDRSHYCMVLVIVTILQHIVCFELHIFRLINFLIFRKLHQILEETNCNQEEYRAMELRGMIGNLAHDLKTPLSSFMTGVDLVASNLLTIENDLAILTTNETRTGNNTEIDEITTMQTHSSWLLSPSTQDAFQCAKECFNNIRNTNLFMLMTINRCLDYTKASKGLKLTPKYETIELKESIQLPLECMKNIQDRIEIENVMIDINKICSHVITDKQWLQENVLCLLSNAVKYSSHGPVTISVSLISDAQKPPLCSKETPLTGIHHHHEPEEQYKEETIINIPITNSRSKKEISPSSSIVCNTLGISSKNKKIVPTTTKEDEEEEEERLGVEDEDEGDSDETSYRPLLQNIVKKNYLCFEVADHGIGLSEEIRRQLFSPFQQAQRLAGGTGLGLYSLAKRLDALQGGYGVESRSDGKQGSVFWFTIPYRPDPTFSFPFSSLTSFMSTKQSTATSGKQLTKEFLPKYSILFVDDSCTISKMANMVMTRQGHTVTLADNGEIGIQKFFQSMQLPAPEDNDQTIHTTIDVIVMDLQMPIMDGLEATRRIRAWEEANYPNTRQIIIGMSANSDAETMDEAFVAGIDDFLPKPFHIDVFNECMQKILLERQKKQEQFLPSPLVFGLNNNTTSNSST